MELNNQIFQTVPKNKTKLDEFWNFCKKLQPKALEKDLETFRQEFEITTKKVQREIQVHKQFLERVPLMVPLRDWLEEVSSSALGAELLSCFKMLIEKQIIPTHDASGHIWDLDLQRHYGHEKIIDNIRCDSSWATSEREKIVSYYLMFAQYLAMVTFGFVPYEGDPDRIKTSRRVLPFEVYLDFVSQLSEREALVAATLYYSGVTVTITEVLGLRVSQVDFDTNSIHFKGETIAYPRHVMNQFKVFLQSRKSDDLVFLNRSGEEVNRSRIFRNFKNASAKMVPSREISPTDLIESRTQ